MMFPISTVWGDLKWLWNDHPDRRGALILVALPCFVGCILMVVFLGILERLGYKWLNPFYKEGK